MVALQAANYIIPLLTFPYLTRTLGVEQFGAYALALAVASYLALFVDWGFAFTAPSQVARERHLPNRLNEIFWSVLFARVGLGAGVLTILYVVIATVPPLQTLWLPLACASGLVLASMLTVSWCLQGLERMSKFALAAVIGKAMTIPATFFLVQDPEDAWIALLIQSGGSAIGGVLSISFVLRLRIIGVPVIGMRAILDQIRQATPLFLSSVAVNIYTSSNTIVLGLLQGPASVGLYAPADRLRMVAQAIIPPISQAVYPRVSRMFVEDRDKGLELSQHVLLLLGAITLVASAALFLAAEPLVILIAGPMFAGAVPVLRWLAPIPFIVSINTVLGMQMMLPLGLNRPFSRVLIRAAAVDLVLIVPLTWYFGAEGAAMSVLAAELWVVTDMTLQLRRAGIVIVPAELLSRGAMRKLFRRLRP
jgi:O-antigen/teichoic acid export membrane protein